MKIRLLLSFLAVSLSMFGQQVNLDLLKNIKPRSVGPAGMSGRITAIDAVTNNPDIIYAGSASGGIWKSTSGGVTWKPIFENEATASIGVTVLMVDSEFIKRLTVAKPGNVWD